MVRRRVFVFALALVATLLAAGAAYAVTKDCDGGTCRGTGGPDVLHGTPRVDKIFGEGGEDEIYGRRAADTLKGQRCNQAEGCKEGLAQGKKV